MHIAMSKCYRFFPHLKFQELPFIARHLKHPERKEDGKFDRYYNVRVSESKLAGEVHSF